MQMSMKYLLPCCFPDIRAEIETLYLFVFHKDVRPVIAARNLLMAAPAAS